MLGTKTATKDVTNNSTNGLGSNVSGETCVVSEGTFLEGQFKSSENVRLDGKIKGEVKCDKRLVMGEKGKIEGKIITLDAVIMGTIEGEIKVEGTLTLKSTGLVRGIIAAKYMVVEEGARYFGECTIG